MSDFPGRDESLQGSLRTRTLLRNVHPHAAVLDGGRGGRVVEVQHACHDALVEKHQQSRLPNPRLFLAGSRG